MLSCDHEKISDQIELPAIDDRYCVHRFHQGLSRLGKGTNQLDYDYNNHQT